MWQLRMVSLHAMLCCIVLAFFCNAVFAAPTSSGDFDDASAAVSSDTSAIASASGSGSDRALLRPSSFSGKSTAASTVSGTLLKGTRSSEKGDVQQPTGSSNGTKVATTRPTAATTTPDTTTSAPAPTNTQPCNRYVEFCTRSYGNITYVGAHNSPFVRPSNAAANQHLDTITQLNDGVRMIQGQTHKANGTIMYCHTSCDILNAGKLEDHLKSIVGWLNKNPFEIVTILIGNGDYLDIKEYVEPVENSGLSKIAYVPENRTLEYSQWPTLSDLILRGKRAVVFIDYKADESEAPYLLDEFTYMWETPFSQTDTGFPCKIDRPPEQDGMQNKLYMANHNLNVNFTAFGTPVLVPNTIEVNRTNGAEGFGSLGLQASNCEAMWGRYPNFLLVDFYDAGNGSVFEVAAKANNVTYRGGCCGKVKSTAAGGLAIDSLFVAIQALLLSVYFVLR